MSDEQTVTQREAVERERKAYAWGFYEGVYTPRDSGRVVADVADRRAALTCPLPKRQRHVRLVLSNGHVWIPVAFPDNAMRFVAGPGKPHPLQNMADMAYVAGECRTAADFRNLARCLDGEMGDIPDGEDA